MLVELIQSFGFPTVVAIGSGWFIWKIYWANQEDSKADKDKLYTVLANVNATNEAILKTNQEISESNRILMNEMKNDICEIKEAVVK